MSTSVVNVMPLRLEGEDGAVTLYATDRDCQRVRNDAVLPGIIYGMVRKGEDVQSFFTGPVLVEDPSQTQMGKMCHKEEEPPVQDPLQTRMVQMTRTEEEPAVQGDFWTHEDTLLLIESYRTNKEKFSDPTKKKIDVLRRIADSFSNRSASACEKKWNNLKHRYKVIKDGQSKTGNRRVTWSYFEKLDAIFRKDPAVEPTFTVSSTGTIPAPRKELQVLEGTETPTPPKKKRKRSTLMEDFIKMQQEENEKRRKEMEDFRKDFLVIQKEKRDLLKDIINLLK